MSRLTSLFGNAIPTAAEAPKPVLSFDWREALRDRGDALLFDWLMEPAGTETKNLYRMFCVPISSERTAAETNLLIPGRLPPPQSFLARSIHAFYGTMAMRDRELFRERYTLRFWIGCKYFYESPLAALPLQGLFLPELSMTDDGAPPQPGDMNKFPRFIPSNVQMGVELIGTPFITDPVGSGLKFLPVVNGILEREVA